MKPQVPVVYTTLSGFYNRQGDFEKTMQSLHQAADLKPNDPTGYQLVATYYWEKAFKDHRLPPAQKKDFIMRGIEATDKAKERDGVVCYGAIGVGGTKMKIHRSTIQWLFTANNLVLDAEEVLAIGREIS